MSADFWAGYISGAAGILLGNPLDLVKVRLQAGGDARIIPRASASSSTSASTSAPTSFSRTVFQRTAALATGAAAPVLGYGALNALLFVSYRQAETFLTATPRAAAGTNPLPAPSAATTWIAGAVAGLATWIVSAPTELIKCRAQLALHSTGGPSPHPSSQAQASPKKSPSSWSIARQVWRAEGLRGFFLGGTVTALRDSIGYGFYFWSYLLATDAWRRYSETPGSRDRLEPPGTSSSPSAAATLMCGGLAGVVTWASVFPLDMIKTRVQAQALLPVASSSSQAHRAPLLGAPGVTAQGSVSAPPHRRLSTLEITRLAYSEGGLSVFFRGLGVCSARAFVVNAVQWAVYEWIMRELGASVHR